MPAAPGSFGAWLKEARGPVSFRRLAAGLAVPVHFSTIQHLEDGRLAPPFELTVRICAFLGYDAWSVIDAFGVVSPDVQETLIRSAIDGPASRLGR